MSKILLPSDLSDAVVKDLLIHSLEVIKTESDTNKDPQFFDAAMLGLTSSLIATYLHANLNEVQRKSVQNTPEEMGQAYRRLKMVLEEAIAKGVMVAMDQFTTQNTDYLCQIKRVTSKTYNC